MYIERTTCVVLLLQIAASVQNDNSTINSPTTTKSPTLTNSPTTTVPTTPIKLQQNVPLPRAMLPPPLQAILSTIHKSKNEYGHVQVREGAFLFWWLYFADGVKEDAYKKPLVIWVQGGPSIPGSGLGNFVEIGPQTLSLKTRPHSWVKGKNVLFVDSPVGTGFSYTTTKDLYCKSDKDVAADLIHALKNILEKYPLFKTTPLHIFSQSYGTKIASYFAYYLAKDIERENIEANLKTVALGGSWVSPKDTTLATPHFMYQLGFLDTPEYQNAINLTANLAAMIDRKEYREALKYRLEILFEIYPRVKSFNSYNVFKENVMKTVDQLTFLMNSFVSLALGNATIGRKWEFYDQEVVYALQDDFMKPCPHVVENILKDTNVRVVVYNGDFDAVTPMAGAVNWVHNLEWYGKDKFWSAKKKCLNGLSNGHFKEHDRLSLWWILKAGHWVPTDNPEAMDQLLQYIVHENKEIFNEAEDNKHESKTEVSTLSTTSMAPPKL